MSTAEDKYERAVAELESKGAKKLCNDYLHGSQRPLFALGLEKRPFYYFSNLQIFLLVSIEASFGLAIFAFLLLDGWLIPVGSLGLGIAIGLIAVWQAHSGRPKDLSEWADV